MLKANKIKLDGWHLRTNVFLPISLTVILIIAFIYYYLFLQEKANEYQNALKFPAIGVFKSSANSKWGTFCFFEVENKVLPIRCSSHFYLVGQRVKLTKIVNKSDDFYYVIGDFSLTHHSSGTPNGAP